MKAPALSAAVPGDNLKVQGSLGVPTLDGSPPLGTPPKKPLIPDARAGIEDLKEALGFAKKADIHQEVPLYDHQRRAASKFVGNGALIVAHGVGTGKTLSSLHMIDEARKVGRAGRALVVVPAGLRNNYLESGVQKYTTHKAAVYGNKEEIASGTHSDIDSPPDVDTHIVSNEIFRQDPEKWIRNTKADTLVVDEFHRARDEHSMTHKALRLARPLVKNFIGLTGSVVSNTPSDIVPLVDIATNGNHPFGKRRDFEARFITSTKQGKKMRDTTQLAKMLDPYVDYFGSDQMRSSDMPKKVSQEVLVEMSPHQHHLFRYAIGKLSNDVIKKLKKDISSLSEREISHIFSRIVHARKASNSIHTLDSRVTAEQSAESTPKVKRLLDDVEQHLNETPDGQAVIHTNLVHGGVDVLRAGLAKRGIEHGVFQGKVGDVTEEARQKDVEDYKAGKKKVLVISSAGGEGLSLPNTTMFASLDGYFNPERITQAEARGVRAGGLAHRPEDQRQVLIRRYVTIPPRGNDTFGASMWNWFSNLFSWGGGEQKDVLDVPSVDRWIYDIAKRKDYLNKELRDSLRKVGSAAIFEPPKSLREEYHDRFGRLALDPKTQGADKLREEENEFVRRIRNSARAKMLAPYMRELLEKALAYGPGDPRLMMILSLLFHRSQELSDFTPDEAQKLVNLSDRELSRLIRGDILPEKSMTPIKIDNRFSRDGDEEPLA